MKVPNAPENRSFFLTDYDHEENNCNVCAFSGSHFYAYAKSQVEGVPPVILHPTQDPDKQMARAIRALIEFFSAMQGH